MSEATNVQYGQVQNYVDGAWISAREEARLINDPVTNEAIAGVGFSSAGDVDDVVAAGQDAFETWRRTPIEERSQPLF
ncbi:MAG: aldehyde dehydrogenase family protein [Halobacteriota archaeon]|uniref:aldehyde dehydrogenase family protein n=1 Tax=Natronomonas sp. TaxID=2184060 RepID=UPI00397548A1